MIKLRLLQVIMLFAAASTAHLAFATDWERVEHCDMPSSSIKELKTESQEKCEVSCDQEKGCQGAVYITGWKKCSLKAEVKKQAKIRFSSADMSSTHMYEAGSFKVDNDHTGKDLERHVLNTADECGKTCEARADCQAFTFIEGYRVCWLKKAGGKLKPKVFHCSIRKS
jgi:hypothetical protein